MFHKTDVTISSELAMRRTKSVILNFSYIFQNGTWSLFIAVSQLSLHTLEKRILRHSQFSLVSYKRIL